MIKATSLLLMLSVLWSCAILNERASVYKEKRPGIGSCYLNSKYLILPYRHYRFSFKRNVNYALSEIELSGYFTANTFLDFIDKETPTFLKKIDIEIIFLGSDRTGVIYSEKFTIKYKKGENPSIFDKIPFSVTLPYSPEYVFVSFSYSSKVYKKFKSKYKVEKGSKLASIPA